MIYFCVLIIRSNVSYKYTILASVAHCKKKKRVNFSKMETIIMLPKTTNESLLYLTEFHLSWIFSLKRHVSILHSHNKSVDKAARISRKDSSKYSELFLNSEKLNGTKAQFSPSVEIIFSFSDSYTMGQIST